MCMYCFLRNLKPFFDSTKETNGYRMDFFIEVCCSVRNLLQGESLSVCFISIKWPFKNLSPGIILLRYELYSVKSRMQSLAAILIAQIKSYEHLADSAVTIKSTNKKFQCWKLPWLIIISLWFWSIKCLFYRQHFYEQYQDEIRKISSNY